MISLTKPFIDNTPSLEIYDPVSTLGHANYNTQLIKNCLQLLPCNIFYTNRALKLNDIIVAKNFKIHYSQKNSNSRIRLFFNHLNMLKKRQHNLINQKHLFICFDNLSMLLACLFTLNKKPLYLICHNNFHRANESIVSRIALKMLKLFNSHLVLLEQSFMPFASVKLRYPLNRLHLLYHPLPNVSLSNIPLKEDNLITISYVSGAHLDKGYDTLLHAIKLYLNTKPSNLIRFNILLGRPIELKPFGLTKKTLKTHHINLIENKISDDKYKQLLHESDYLCLPFRKQFFNRCSAVFFEAVSYKKNMITSNIPLFKSYIDLYGSIGLYYEEANAQQLSKIFLTIEKMTLQPGIRKILSDRTNALLQQQLFKLFQL
ncbi:hypothetical protein L3V83_03155 [Thiotrichales bacterium 19X7-9]|nr:hypothetical protein [Thiotrichales bacterium 19X7-9]